MMRKARLAIRKVNVALDSPGYYFGYRSQPGRKIGVKKCSRSFPRSKKLGSRLNSESFDSFDPAYLKLVRFPARSPLPIAALP
jgi:hypothetical protein